MTEMTYLCFVGFLGVCCHIVFVKTCYFRHEAICLSWTRSYDSFFITYPLYEYILLEKDRIVTYQHSGTTVFFPKKGKKYKILIRKTDHTKVMAYGWLVLEICWALFFLFIVIWDVYGYLT